MNTPIRKTRSREELIEYLKKSLGSNNTSFIFCRDGVEDALAELQKPPLPDDAYDTICNVLLRSHTLSPPDDVLARRIVDALKPKPRTKTVWRVTWGEAGCGQERDFTDLGAASRQMEIKENATNLKLVRVTVPA